MGDQYPLSHSFSTEGVRNVKPTMRSRWRVAAAGPRCSSSLERHRSRRARPWDARPSAMKTSLPEGHACDRWPLFCRCHGGSFSVALDSMYRDGYRRRETSRSRSGATPSSDWRQLRGGWRLKPRSCPGAGRQRGPRSGRTDIMRSGRLRPKVAMRRSAHCKTPPYPLAQHSARSRPGGSSRRLVSGNAIQSSRNEFDAEWNERPFSRIRGQVLPSKLVN